MSINCSDKHLPIVANSFDISVKHYILDLTCLSSEKIMHGSIILFMDHENCPLFNLTSFAWDISKFSQDLKNSLYSTDNVIDRPSSTLDDTKEFELTLECKDIIVKRVSEIVFQSSFYFDWLENLLSCKFIYDRAKFLSGCFEKNLNYSVSEWSLKISKSNVLDKSLFPKVVKIYYETKPCGKSLRWTSDQDSWQVIKLVHGYCICHMQV